MNKPIDLIVANVMHEAASIDPPLRRIVDIMRKSRPDIADSFLTDIREDTARRLLTSIAVNGRIADVYTALSAVGAPASSEMIGEGVQAVKDRQGTP